MISSRSLDQIKGQNWDFTGKTLEIILLFKITPKNKGKIECNTYISLSVWELFAIVKGLHL